MSNHEMLVQSKYLPVLRCGPCDRAISRGIEETDAQWRLRVDHFQRAHDNMDAPPLETSNFRQGQMSIALYNVACTLCGTVLWQDPGELVSAFVRRARAWQKEHMDGTH